ncbi:MAG: autotransporter domain-containing protein [Hyphomicrobiales bacterium]
MRKRIHLSCLLAASTCLTAETASADFTIGPGQTVNATQTLTSNETGTVEAGGTLITNGDAITGNDGNTIINAGIVTSGDEAIEVGIGNTITNSGTLISGGEGIQANSNNVITNTGTITSDDEGIRVQSGNTISNSGTVISTNDDAVDFRGSNNILRLLAGSALQGNLALRNATNTLIIGPGLNTALGFTGDPTIQADGLPFVVVNDTVYVVDVTGFSVHDEMVGDLTRSVGRSLEDRLSAARQGEESDALSALALGYAPMAPVMGIAETPSNGFWASGLGGYRSQDGGTTTLDFETRFAGALGGFDTMVAPETRLGVFGGLSFADVDTGVVGQELSASSVFGGLYLGQDLGHYTLDASLTAGWTDFDSERRVASNAVVGGIETARASYGGAFISPALTLGTDFSVGTGTLSPSMRVRYAGLFLDSYTETGSAANLTVGERAIHIFEAGAELTYALAALDTGAGVFEQSFSVGVDGTLVEGDAVSATVVGQALSFNAETDDTVRGFLGYDVAIAMTERTSLSVSAEAGYDSNGALTLDGRAGLSLAF